MSRALYGLDFWLTSPPQLFTMCGVGFICHIKGQAAHKIVSDARNILCNMTHRGASEFPSDRTPTDIQPVPMREMVMVQVS